MLQQIERRKKINMLHKSIGPYPLGVWVAFVVLLVVFFGWGMQAYSILNWDGAVDLGFQNERFSGDAVERAWVRKRLFGFGAGLMEFAITVYFPIVFAFQRWTTYRSTALVALFLWAVPSLVGIICLWANRRSFTH
jgi:hypothetical protein